MILLEWHIFGGVSVPFVVKKIEPILLVLVGFMEGRQINFDGMKNIF